ncbi:MAG: flagellar export protein FliJ [Gammaproteobacteria bacterium]|nr:flagellar export protein FliJ [Gammaproteobacteria bacterium]
MQPIVHLEEQKEQDAVQLFVDARRALDAVEQQLQQLHGFKQEYQQRLQSEQGQGISIQRLREYQSFIENISGTIDKSYLEIEAKRAVCEKYKQAWLRCRSRSQAMHKVVEKYQREERRQQERVEQKDQDEYAQRISSRTAGDE